MELFRERENKIFKKGSKYKRKFRKIFFVSDFCCYVPRSALATKETNFSSFAHCLSLLKENWKIGWKTSFSSPLTSIKLFDWGSWKQSSRLCHLWFHESKRELSVAILRNNFPHAINHIDCYKLAIFAMMCKNSANFCCDDS